MADDDLADFYKELEEVAAADGDAGDGECPLHSSTELASHGEPSVAGEPQVQTLPPVSNPSATNASISSAPSTTAAPPPSKKPSTFAPRALVAKVISKPAVIHKPEPTVESGAAAVAAAPMYVPVAFGLGAFGAGSPLAPPAAAPALPSAYSAAAAPAPTAAGASSLSSSSSAAALSGGSASAALAGQKRKAPPAHFTTRTCAGEVWVDPTLADWPENDCRLFVGDLGKEVTDEVLAGPFQQYRSFAKARVVREHRTQKSKGYGFVSFLEPLDALAAMKDMAGKYIGNRPVRIKRANWTEKSIVEVRRREKEREKRDSLGGGGAWV